MPQAIQRRRGTTADHAAFTGLNAELTVDTTKKTVVVHDGVTLGGTPLATAASVGNPVQQTSSTGSTKGPVGTTAQRDVAPQYGWERINSTLGLKEWWNGAAWVPMSGAASGANADITSLAALTAQTSNRNLLINGNFNFNQRAYVSAAATGAANQYTLDRWRVVTSGQNLAFTASGNGRVVTAPAGGIEQVIEGANIGVAACVISWVGTATCTVDGVAKAKGASVTLVPGTNSTVKFVGGTVSLAQLEPGPVPTPFEFRPYGAELAMCQRYFCIFDAACGGSYPAGSSNASSSTGVMFPVPMRTTPSFAYGPAAYNNNAAVNISVLSNLSCTFQVTIQANPGTFNAAHIGNTASAEF